MSALGQKQTCAPQKAMSALPLIATAKADMPQMATSALPPTADMCGANRDVCFGPKADMVWWLSLNLQSRDFSTLNHEAKLEGHRATRKVAS